MFSLSIARVRAAFPCAVAMVRVLIVHSMLWIGTLVLVQHLGGMGSGSERGIVPFMSFSQSPTIRTHSSSSTVLSMPLPTPPASSSWASLHTHAHAPTYHRDRARRHHDDQLVHHHGPHGHHRTPLLLHGDAVTTSASTSTTPCSNITTCIDIGANTTSPQPCGWCWDTNTALPGNAQGPFNASGATCQDWTYEPESCILHIDCTALPSCENILGTTCGWCETTGQGMPGTASGPRDGSCDDWIYAATLCPSTNQPQQVHLSYSPDPTVMYVTWSSSQSSDSVAYYYDLDEAASGGSGGGDVDHENDNQQGHTITWLKATGDTTYFFNNNELGFKYIHRVNMSALVPGHRYLYFVANGGIRSPSNFTFRAMPLVNDFPARFIVFGDMGRYGGAPSLQALIDEVHGANESSSSVDVSTSASASAFSDIPVTAVLHVGDFAYDLLTDLGMNGDAFFQRIERIAGYVPYLPCVGNHEIEWDNSYSHYRNRFTTPSSWVDDGWRMWWSVDVQLVHFVSYSTEVLFEDPQKLASAQLDWLRDDLKQANVNRAVRPWIVAFGHRPMYCSNNDGDDCTTDQSVTRLALETLFYEMGVDVVLEAHEHSYERLWPVYNLTVTQQDYVNPRAPVHLITGQAGCNEDDGVCINTIPGPRGAWSAFRQANAVSYGYGHLVPVNATHLYWDQVMVQEKDQVLDAIWIVQHNHGPFHNDQHKQQQRTTTIDA